MSTTPTLNPSDETLTIGPLQIRFLLTAKDTNGTLSLFELVVPAGRKLAAPAHRNDAYEETLYGLRGTVTWTIDGRPVAVGPGEAVCIPRGAVHRFDNLGTEDATQLSIVTPALMGPEYFREAGAIVEAAAGGPPDVAQMIAVFRRHGMTIAAPPAGR